MYVGFRGVDSIGELCRREIPRPEVESRTGPSGRTKNGSTSSSTSARVVAYCLPSWPLSFSTKTWISFRWPRNASGTLSQQLPLRASSVRSFQVRPQRAKMLVASSMPAKCRRRCCRSSTAILLGSRTGQWSTTSLRKSSARLFSRRWFAGLHVRFATARKEH